MRTVSITNRFKKDYKLTARRGKNVAKLLKIVEHLASGEKLDTKSRDHSLGGEYQDCRECHIEGDWLLIYMIIPKEVILVRTGSHADLFE